MSEQASLSDSHNRSIVQERRSSVFNKLGEKYGRKFILPDYQLYEQIGNAIEIERIYGAENIADLPQDESVVFALNYPGPLNMRGKAMKSKGIVPASIIASRVIEHITHKKPKAAAVNGGGTLGSAAKLFGEGVIHAIGQIPVDKSLKRWNREFYSFIDEAVSNHEWINVFAEGIWSPPNRDYNKNPMIVARNKSIVNEPGIMQPGAAHIAERHNIKIVPVFIHCDQEWNIDQKAIVSFGKPIDTHDIEGTPLSKQHTRNVDNVSQLISDEIGRLQKQVIADYPDLLQRYHLPYMDTVQYLNGTNRPSVIAIIKNRLQQVVKHFV